MTAKCGISEETFEKLAEYYKLNGIKDGCLKELIKWDEDLRFGNNEALRMCDSWGEDLVWDNWPGLQDQIRQTQCLFPPAVYGLRQKRLGITSQCRQAVRLDQNGDEIYRGQYALSRPLTHGFKLNGGDFIESLPETIACLEECGGDENCEFACMPRYIRLMDFYFIRGICYPSSCSAAEILILQLKNVNVSDIIEFEPLDEVNKNTGPNYRALTWKMDIETFKPRIERVYLPTFASFVIFTALWLIVMGVASYWFGLNVQNGADHQNQSVFIKVFAYQGHWSKLLSTKRPTKAITVIDGVRTLSMAWVILGHFYILYMGGQNSYYAMEKMQNGRDGIVLFATLSVDSFFFIGGLLLAYLSTDTIINTFNSIRKFIPNYTLYLINRWMRLTPMCLYMAWILVTLIPIIPEGFSVRSATNLMRPCQKDLWKSIFFLSGWFDGPAYACNGVQWYLSCDFFYFGLFPFIAMLYGRKKWIGILVVCLFSMGSWAHNYWSSYVNPGYIAQTYRIMNGYNSQRKYDPYFPPWARYHSHGVGVLFGWLILSQRKNSVFTNFLSRRRNIMKAAIITLLWLVSLFCLAFAIWGVNSCFRVHTEEPSNYWEITFDNPAVSFSGCLTDGNGNPDWIAISFWNASHRILWCTGLGLMILLCDTGYGLLINWFLSNEVFMIIGKISFSMYLLHIAVLSLMMGTYVSSWIFDSWFIAWNYAGSFLAIAMASAILHIVIELPCATAWALVLKRIKGLNSQKTEKVVADEELANANMKEKTY